MGFRIKNIAGSNPNLVAMESRIHVLSDKYLKTVLDFLTLGKVLKQTRLPLSQHFFVLVFDRILICIYRMFLFKSVPSCSFANPNVREQNLVLKWEGDKFKILRTNDLINCSL